MLPISSYHDVFIEINGEKYQFSSMPYGYLLQCTRAAGWELWSRSEKYDQKDDQLIAGEYLADEEDARIPFRLWFGEHLVFDSTLKKN